VYACGAPVLLCRFPRRPAQRCMTSRAQRGTFAPSTVIRTGFACTFRGHDFGENLYCFIFLLSPLPQFVRSGVGGILTSPSCLVEGVRSGSRRRNAATASVLAGEGMGPESRRPVPATPTLHCAAGMRSMSGACVGRRRSPAPRNGVSRYAHMAKVARMPNRAIAFLSRRWRCAAPCPALPRRLPAGRPQ